MMMKAIAVLLAAAQAASAASVAAPLNIGVASAVRGAVKATAPGAAGRVVETGKPVYSHDKVTTGPEGKLQILLLDQTSFTIGANSELELDEFVFDPNTNVGKVSAKIAKGAFRFVTGKVARRDPAAMQVETPVGTIGIRGTMTAGTVSGSEATIILLGPGPENNADEKTGGITVKNDKGSVEVDKDGWGVTVKAGEAPSKPFELSPSQLDAVLSGTGSTPKGDSKDDAGAGGSSGSSSGQDTAKGKDNAGDAFAAFDAAQSENTGKAVETAFKPSVAKWDEVRGIPGGTGKYSASGAYYNCTGGTCGTTSIGTMSIAMAVDFGAKTIGGGSSSISLPGASGATGSILSLSYANLSGDAAASLSLSGSGDFTGTSVKLLNTGGVTAGSATFDVRALNSSGPNPTQTYGGELTAPFTP